MPNLMSLCLRYLLWITATTIVFLLAVNVMGLPLGPATQVILAAVPALDIATRAVRWAGHVPGSKPWGLLALALFAVYLAFEVVLIALFVPQLFTAIVEMEAGTGTYLLTRAMVLPMLALFLFLGLRTERARQQQG